jgi:Mrp family chromosome partitioning ATPase
LADSYASAFDSGAHCLSDYCCGSNGFIQIKSTIIKNIRITVTGGKDGVDKSMIATSLAALFVQNKKILLTDADAECPNDHLLLDIKSKNHL